MKHIARQLWIIFFYWSLIALLAAARPAFGSGRGDDAANGAKKDAALFREVGSILTGKCLTCHASDKRKGKLDLTRRSLALAGGKSGPAIIAGKAADSLLYQKLAAGEMPPQNPLAPEQVRAFRRWIDAGAPYETEPLVAAVQRAGPDWWSLRPIQQPNLPRVKDTAWLRTPIDAFILARLEQQGLAPAPEAGRATLIRRASFDLLGLPPTPEEIHAFVHDPDPDAYEKLIDRLLASPRYGERWGRHWLDIVRFAESHGYETNELRPRAWPYRDYVIRSFNEDRPYPEFVLEQLAGDTVPGADWLVQSATGFLVGGAHDVVGNQTVEGMLQQRMDDLDDMVATTGATFLGLTVNCCRCHDHKFDPLTQRDYYGLQAVFAGVQHAERVIVPPDADQRNRDMARLQSELTGLEQALDRFEPLAQPDTAARRPPVNPRRNVERFPATAARFMRFSIAATSDRLEPCIDELEVYADDNPARNVALASRGTKARASSTFPNSPIHRLEHLCDGQYGNSRSWISNEPGKGWVEIDLGASLSIGQVVWGRDRLGQFKDRLATQYRIEVATEPGQWRLVASSSDRLPYQPGVPNELAGLSADRQRERKLLLSRRTRLQERLASLQASTRIYAGSFSTPGPTHLLTRGDPMQKAEPVAPSAIAVVRPPLLLDPQTSERERRLALARWICHPDNPLPARVMVNRLWHYHFGQGIVATPSDFGYNGDRPSHPELLDWLASAYRRAGWRLKPLHRLIMLSAAYRQSGRPDAKAQAVDSQDRLLWRRLPRRLEAEAVRDAILSVSGKLDQRMGGPGYNLWEKNTNYVVVFKPKGELGPDEFRRMVYQFKPRTQQDPTFGIFDCPDAALAKPRRTASTTALQALNLLNSRFVLAQSEAFARRLQREVGDDAGRQIRRAFDLALGRKPTDTELQQGTELIKRHGVWAFCRAIYNADEFLYVD